MRVFTPLAGRVFEIEGFDRIGQTTLQREGNFFTSDHARADWLHLALPTYAVSDLVTECLIGSRGSALPD